MTIGCDVGLQVTKKKNEFKLKEKRWEPSSPAKHVYHIARVGSLGTVYKRENSILVRMHKRNLQNYRREFNIIYWKVRAIKLQSSQFGVMGLVFIKMILYKILTGTCFAVVMALLATKWRFEESFRTFGMTFSTSQLPIVWTLNTLITSRATACMAT